jgi:hypothetical protein
MQWSDGRFGGLRRGVDLPKIDADHDRSGLVWFVCAAWGARQAKVFSIVHAPNASKVTCAVLLSCPVRMHGMGSREFAMGAQTQADGPSRRAPRLFFPPPLRSPAEPGKRPQQIILSTGNSTSREAASLARLKVALGS